MRVCITRIKKNSCESTATVICSLKSSYDRLDFEQNDSAIRKARLVSSVLSSRTEKTFELSDRTGVLHRNSKSRLKSARLNSHHLTLARKLNRTSDRGDAQNQDKGNRAVLGNQQRGV